jgi:hypothetical protein
VHVRPSGAFFHLIKVIFCLVNGLTSVSRLVPLLNPPTQDLPPPNTNYIQTHSPQNGSEVIPGYLTPDEKFTFTIAKDGQQKDCKPAASYLKVAEPAIERWNFTWYEDLFAQAAKTPSLVKVASKAYRKVALYEPGNYIATLTYANGSVTQANWTVRDTKISQKAKNVIMFIGDGMTTNMITAARL